MQEKSQQTEIQKLMKMMTTILGQNKNHITLCHTEIVLQDMGKITEMILHNNC